jgi:surface antigen
VHPIDTSRAPILHTFIDNGNVDYGKATAAVYGHVRYSSDVKNDKSGAVSAEQLTNYVTE